MSAHRLNNGARNICEVCDRAFAAGDHWLEVRRTVVDTCRVCWLIGSVLPWALIKRVERDYPDTCTF